MIRQKETVRLDFVGSLGALLAAIVVMYFFGQMVGGVGRAFLYLLGLAVVVTAIPGIASARFLAKEAIPEPAPDYSQKPQDRAVPKDISDFLEETTSLVSARFGFQFTGVFVLDGSNEYAVLQAASSRIWQQMPTQGQRLKVSEQEVLRDLIETGDKRVALNVDADATYFGISYIPHIRSELALPLKLGEVVVGVVYVQSAERAAFSNEDVAILEAFAGQAAIAIENARLYEKTTARLAELRALQYTRMRYILSAFAEPRFSIAEEEVMRRWAEQTAAALDSASQFAAAHFSVDQMNQAKEIITRIRASIEIETVLRNAAEELAQVLGTETASPEARLPADTESSQELEAS